MSNDKKSENQNLRRPSSPGDKLKMPRLHLLEKAPTFGRCRRTRPAMAASVGFRRAKRSRCAGITGTCRPTARAGGHDVVEPTGWLLASWMGRSYGFIEAPAVNHPALTTHPASHGPPRGAKPCSGPPRPT